MERCEQRRCSDWCLIDPTVPSEKKAMPVRIGRKKKSKGVDGVVKLPLGK